MQIFIEYTYFNDVFIYFINFIISSIHKYRRAMLSLLTTLVSCDF